VPAPPLSFAVPSNAGLYETSDQGDVIDDDEGNPIRIIGPLVDPFLSFGLANDGTGPLRVTSPNYWPTNTVGLDHPGLASYGLAPGDLYSLNGLAYVVPGNIPDPSAPLVFFGKINQRMLLLLGGKILPLSYPGVLNVLWNNNGVVWISGGSNVAIWDEFNWDDGSVWG
jgi:hypothetical protein